MKAHDLVRFEWDGTKSKEKPVFITMDRPDRSSVLGTADDRARTFDFDCGK